MKEAKLTGTERELLDFVLSKTEKNSGYIQCRANQMAADVGCHRDTAYTFIRKMKQHGMFLDKGGDLHLNPFFFWVGNANSCHQERSHLRLASRNGKTVGI